MIVILGFFAGTVLGFLFFLAAFSGMPVLVLPLVVAFGCVSSVVVRRAAVSPAFSALIVAIPAAPWAIWLWLASTPQESLWRSSVWLAGFASILTASFVGAYFTG